MQDSFQHKRLRQQLIDQLIAKGITNKEVLRVMGKIPRHLFVEGFLEHVAYEDRALPISSGQTISQPYTVAFQSSLLDLKIGDKILEVGTGSGYQTAVLEELGIKVFSIERQKELFAKAQVLLNKMGYRPALFYGDGYLGKPTYGPYDKILITAGAPEIPEKLLEQLKIGGLLVAPIGIGDSQIMTRVKREALQEYTTHTFGYFSFVPMLKGTS